MFSSSWVSEIGPIPPTAYGVPEMIIEGTLLPSFVTVTTGLEDWRPLPGSKRWAQTMEFFLEPGSPDLLHPTDRTAFGEAGQDFSGSVTVCPLVLEARSLSEGGLGSRTTDEGEVGESTRVGAVEGHPAGALEPGTVTNNG